MSLNKWISFPPTSTDTRTVNGYYVRNCTLYLFTGRHCDAPGKLTEISEQAFRAAAYQCQGWQLALLPYQDPPDFESYAGIYKELDCH